MQLRVESVAKNQHMEKISASGDEERILKSYQNCVSGANHGRMGHDKTNLHEGMTAVELYFSRMRTLAFSSSDSSIALAQLASLSSLIYEYCQLDDMSSMGCQKS